MRIVFTGGGTGGHIFPNIAVIDELKRISNRPSRSEAKPLLRPQGATFGEFRATHGIFYIGGKNSAEEKIVQAHGIPFYGIYVGKLRRYFDFQNFVDMVKIPIGFFESLRILKKLKPNLVFAKGGYVSFPVILAARLLKIPVWLHESDVSPGLANKICSRFAQKMWLSFEESKNFFPRKHTTVVGNPIRREILKGDQEKGYKLTGFSPKLPVILVIGGSTGAQSLNKLIEAILPQLLQKVQIVHITGVIARSEATKQSQRLLRYARNDKNYKTFEFLNEELAHIYAIADLVVSRAGSGSIFETLACHKPMILIPLPAYASRGDQIENARVFEEHGWAIALNQDGLQPQNLLDHIELLLKNKELCDKMIQHQKTAHFAQAARKIAEALITLF